MWHFSLHHHNCILFFPLNCTDEQDESIDSTLIKTRVTRNSKLKSIQVQGSDVEQPLLTHSCTPWERGI